MRGNELKAEGAKHLSEGLKANKALISLEYAALHPKSLVLSAAYDTYWPLTVDFSRVIRRLDNNELCGLNFMGTGTYTAEGIIKICEMLKVNTTLSSLR